jgi:hypothetical protein
MSGRGRIAAPQPTKQKECKGQENKPERFDKEKLKETLASGKRGVGIDWSGAKPDGNDSQMVLREQENKPECATCKGTGEYLVGSDGKNKIYDPCPFCNPNPQE